jgi:hypothetical protein
MIIRTIALVLSSLGDMFIQAEVGNQLFKFEIFFFELSQFAQFGGAHTGEFLVPAIEGLFGDAEFAADFEHRSASLNLSKSDGDLCFGEFGFLHRNLFVERCLIVADS